jgi:hypothetical protein
MDQKVELLTQYDRRTEVPEMRFLKTITGYRAKSDVEGANNEKHLNTFNILRKTRDC